ncbi:NAD(P)-dependent oxidoreductase [Rhizobium sp. CSW-27]|uniref:DUF1932 domain-containing protein n=1 Tax=Rhizobium sp. CSW-27 TaxID=2839985 RepID=UPI001C02E15D|nr:NAD(P)-dependent oxidoreductase [Rhizobium sp. CSW-27]MBT9372853.1 DUF1932 domain-containing protein [Rhizobium sp. CSW-27]
MTESAGNFPAIAFVGFGEASHAIAVHWHNPGTAAIRAYDCKLMEDGTLVRDRCRQAGVEGHASPGPALAGAELIFCLVTADQALDAAKACAASLATGALWLDGNSCAPQTKQKAAEVIAAAGGRYVDMAIMAPVYPKRHEVPVLLAGPHAKGARQLLLQLGMRPEVAGERVGDASSIKMLRSIIVKGLEALTSECLLAARRAGVEEAVIASLQASDPGIDWRRRGAYNLERMLVHGGRRAAEMEEVCAMLTAFGLPDWMSRSTVEWQHCLAGLDLDPGAEDLAARADRVIERL